MLRAAMIAIKEYIEKDLKVQDSDKEPIYFDHYNPDDLHQIIETEHKFIRF
jgi:hypothetical protein